LYGELIYPHRKSNYIQQTKDNADIKRGGSCVRHTFEHLVDTAAKAAKAAMQAPCTREVDYRSESAPTDLPMRAAAIWPVGRASLMGSGVASIFRVGNGGVTGGEGVEESATAGTRVQQIL
jgi:hypothetical protein